jgi:hypothetical protein
MWPWLVVAIGTGLATFFVTRKGGASTSGASPNKPAPQGTGINPGIGAKKIVESGDPFKGRDPFKDAVVVADQQGVAWLVAPDYIGPVGIGEAAEIAKAAGGELPSPGLVDAIWRAADLKILPPVRAQNIVSEAVFADQKKRIQGLIGDTPHTLVAGTYKDIVQLGGHPQLYGWHVEDGKQVAGVPLHKPFTPGPGKIIQGPSGSVHSLGFKDYSQGLRLVKKA